MTFTDRLDELMKIHNISSKAELARLSDIPYTTIDSLYKKGSDNIKLSTLQKLCGVFDCSLDYLADGKPSGNQIFQLTGEDTAMLDFYKGLNAIGRKKVREYAADLLSSYSEE